MTSRSRTCALALVAIATALGATAVAPPANGRAAQARPPVKVLTDGLDGPFGLMASARRGFVVAESDTGQITRVSRQGKQDVVFGHAKGVAAATSHRKHVFAVMGGPNETTDDSGDAQQRMLKRGAVPADVATYPPTAVLRSGLGGGQVDVIAHLQSYELKHNPDGQVQYVNGQQVDDALSNPFAMNQSRSVATTRALPT